MWGWLSVLLVTHANASRTHNTPSFTNSFILFSLGTFRIPLKISSVLSENWTARKEKARAFFFSSRNTGYLNIRSGGIVHSCGKAPNSQNDRGHSGLVKAAQSSELSAISLKWRLRGTNMSDFSTSLKTCTFTLLVPLLQALFTLVTERKIRGCEKSPCWLLFVSMQNRSAGSSL